MLAIALFWGLLACDVLKPNMVENAVSHRVYDESNFPEVFGFPRLCGLNHVEVGHARLNYQSAGSAPDGGQMIGVGAKRPSFLLATRAHPAYQKFVQSNLYLPGSISRLKYETSANGAVCGWTVAVVFPSDSPFGTPTPTKLLNHDLFNDEERALGHDRGMRVQRGNAVRLAGGPPKEYGGDQKPGIEKGSDEIKKANAKPEDTGRVLSAIAAQILSFFFANWGMNAEFGKRRLWAVAFYSACGLCILSGTLGLILRFDPWTIGNLILSRLR